MLEVRVCPKCRTEYDAPSTRCSFDGSILLDSEEVSGADTPPFGVPAVPAALGTLGPYTLLSVLGEGTMAVVYAAEHQKLGRRCAIKRLRTEHLVDREMVHRFLAEARTVASIQHPNLVTIYDVVEEPTEAYLVMELLDGRDLETVLLTGHLSIERALRIAIEMCEALLPVHARRVVHRDIKPANVFLCIVGGEEHVKMLDFGAARLHAGRHGASESSGERRLHRDGMTLGSPLYMSPEQASGEPIDHRSDLYAVGVVLYQMLTGYTPFTGETFSDVMLQHVHHEPRPPSETGVPVPRELERVVMKSLLKSPGDRYQTAGELAGDLRSAATALGFDIEGDGSRQTLSSRRGAPGWGIGAAAGVVLLAIAGMAVALTRPATQPLSATPVAPPVAPIAATAPGDPPPRADGRRDVKFETQPPGAIADPQGSTEGCATPCSLAVPSGELVVTFHKPGFADQEVRVAEGERQVRVTLRPAAEVAIVPRAAPTEGEAPRPKRPRRDKNPSTVDNGTLNPFGPK